MGYIELDGNKFDSEKKDVMLIFLWICVVNNDCVNIIYGSFGVKGVYYFSIKLIGLLNVVVYWLYKLFGGKVIFDVSIEFVVFVG